MCLILQRLYRTKMISQAVVSWGFHKPVCYHILIKMAPLCLPPSIWCEAVAQCAQQAQQKPNTITDTKSHSDCPLQLL